MANMKWHQLTCDTPHRYKPLCIIINSLKIIDGGWFQTRAAHIIETTMIQSGCIIVDICANMWIIIMDPHTKVICLAVILKVKHSSGVENPQLLKYWGVYKIPASPSSLPSCLALSSSPFPPRPLLPIICQKLCRFLSLKTRPQSEFTHRLLLPPQAA